MTCTVLAEIGFAVEPSRRSKLDPTIIHEKLQKISYSFFQSDNLSDLDTPVRKQHRPLSGIDCFSFLCEGPNLRPLVLTRNYSVKNLKRITKLQLTIVWEKAFEKFLRFLTIVILFGYLLQGRHFLLKCLEAWNKVITSDTKHCSVFDCEGKRNFSMAFPQIIAAFLALFDAIGLPGNLLVIMIIILRKNFHVMRYVLLASLAISDLLFLILVNSFRIASIAQERWLYGDKMCYLNAFLSRYFYINTVLHLMAVSYDRYDSIVKSPLTYNRERLPNVGWPS